jgi:hypothetical protein
MDRKASAIGDGFPNTPRTSEPSVTQWPGALDGLTTPHCPDSCIRYSELCPCSLQDERASASVSSLIPNKVELDGKINCFTTDIRTLCRAKVTGAFGQQTGVGILTNKNVQHVRSARSDILLKFDSTCSYSFWGSHCTCLSLLTAHTDSMSPRTDSTYR